MRHAAKTMNIRPIRSEVDYDWALKEIGPYFEREPRRGTPEADRFDVLATLIEAYEAKHWPIDPPDAVEAIRFRMEQSGLRQADLARLIGSRSRASEILRRKRALTLEQAWRLHDEWQIPAESLLRPAHLAGDR
jgi:HTH-type transcriptional regulator/antitoxin HigA